MLTIAACVYVLSGLAAITWVIFGVWLAIVLTLLLPVGPAPTPGWSDEPTSGAAVMTLLVGFAPGQDDRAGLELAALLARSAGEDLRARHRRPGAVADPGRRRRRPGVRGLVASARRRRGRGGRGDLRRATAPT